MVKKMVKKQIDSPSSPLGADAHRTWSIVIAGLVLGIVLGFAVGQMLSGNAVGKSVASPVETTIRVTSFALSSTALQLDDLLQLSVDVTNEGGSAVGPLTIQVDFGDGDVLGAQGNAGTLLSGETRHMATSHAYLFKGTYPVVVYVDGVPLATQTVGVG